MGFAEILTVVFIVLKLTGHIGWEWWQVLLPEIIAVGVYIITFISILIYNHRLLKGGEFNGCFSIYSW